MRFFDSLTDANFVYFKDCYKACGGHCCNALSDDENILPMLEPEFLSMKKNGGLNNIDFFHKTFVLKCGKSINIYFLICKNKGLCKPHKNRPLVCKIYPYFPLVSKYGEFLGVREISFYDLFYKDDKNHPCTLINLHKNELLQMYKQNIQKIIKEPIMIFVFMVFEIIDRHLKSYFNQNFKNIFFDDLSKSEKKMFFKNNNLFLALKSNAFQDDINELYLSLESIYKNDISRYFQTSDIKP